jgi:valyl-tRNA synthetase
MNGHRVLWVPGTDHAGLATQNVVERHLAAQREKSMQYEEKLRTLNLSLERLREIE